MGSSASAGQSTLVADYVYLRKAVGWLGTLLPVILLIANPIALRIVHSSCAWLPASVSGYYYSPVRNILVGALCALGLFLLAYVGDNLGDRVITDLAGLFALGVALVPTTPTVTAPASLACETVARLSRREQVVGDIHAVSSVLFFLFLAWMAIRFTTNSPQDARRNWIYRICAIVILASVTAAIITNFLPSSLWPPFPWLFLYEAVGVFAFGVSWFVKGANLIASRKRYALTNSTMRKFSRRIGLSRSSRAIGVAQTLRVSQILRASGTRGIGAHYGLKREAF